MHFALRSQDLDVQGTMGGEVIDTPRTQNGRLVLRKNTIIDWQVTVMMITDLFIFSDFLPL